MNNTTSQSVQPGIHAVADEQQTKTVQIDYELQQLPSLMGALLRVVSAPEITKPLAVMIDLVSDYGPRACFGMAGRQWGCSPVTGWDATGFSGNTSSSQLWAPGGWSNAVRSSVKHVAPFICG